MKVVAAILNQAGFKKISIFDPHSEVSTALIDRTFSNTSDRYFELNYCATC